MNQVEYYDLFESIKLDNLVLFSSYVEGCENLSFGRFPILSLCYLYNSKKILKEYQSKLYKISQYLVVDEFIEIYETFKPVAGRCLRLYLKSESIVSPLEMLAILHNDNLLKKKYKLFDKNEIILSNIESIYTIHGQKVVLGTYDIRISKAKLSINEKRKIKTALFLSMSFCILVSIVYIIFGFTTGLGTGWSLFNVASQQQLVIALKSGGKYELGADIYIDKLNLDTEFNGEIDGNNYTIYVRGIEGDCLLKKNNGTIKNLNIVYSDIDTQITESLSLFVKENNGVLENINIICNRINLECLKSESDDIFFSSIATINNGNIDNCTTLIKGTFKGKQNGECYIGGIVGENNKSITNCEVLEGSNIKSYDADVAGIVAINNENGIVYNCKNLANITQNSKQDGWSPNVGGIILTNYGKVEHSYNLGSLLVESNNNSEENNGSIFVGGITAMNYGNITQCLNSGDLKSKSKRLITYCGGISAYSYYRVIDNQYVLSSINNSIANGVINITSEHANGYVFAGGICGYLYGEMIGCVSLSTFTNGYTEDKYFIGLSIGSAYLQYQLFGSVICITASNNYVLNLDNVIYQIGSLINNGRIVSTGLDSVYGEIVNLNTIEQIKEQEVYWYEK